ncbi:MAG: hypothetical protein KDA78_11780, partial [Planctomycetaceae bacterium]|nr:hypothetical protein [Planctomycetaceae bacterium]
MSNANTIRCSHCGVELARPAKLEANMKLVCGSCGHGMVVKSPRKSTVVAPVAPVAPVVTEPPPRSGWSGSTVAGLTVLLLVVGVGAGYGISQFSNGQQQGPGPVTKTSGAEQSAPAVPVTQKPATETKEESRSAAPAVTSTEDAVNKLAGIPSPTTPEANPAEGQRRFISATGRVLAIGAMKSFDGTHLTVKTADGTEVRMTIDNLSPEDQKFVLDQPPGSQRNDLPALAQTGASLPGMASSAGPGPVVADSGPPAGNPAPDDPRPLFGKQNPRIPLNAPPGFPLVRDWVDSNGRVMIRGEFGGVKPGGRVVIKLLQREWAPSS